MTLESHINHLISRLPLPHSFLLAISGGSDSMALLQAFMRTAHTFEVAHVNYGFRKQSQQEQQLVETICQDNNIPCHVLKLNGYQDLDDSDTNNLQAYARMKRYNYFNEILVKNGLQYIVTAHHSLDNTETVLMNIFHSTTFMGLRGMQTVENNIFRPLLNISKTEIQKYIALRNIAYYDDESNAGNDYKRNHIRNEIIPIIEQQFPQFKKTFPQNIEHWKKIIEFYKKMIDNHVFNHIKNDEKTGIKHFFYKKIMKSPYHQDIVQVLLHQFHFNQNQVAELIKLFSAQNGAILENDHFQMIKEGEKVMIKDKTNIHLLLSTHHEISRSEIHQGGSWSFDNFEIKITEPQSDLQFDENNYYISCDQLPEEDPIIIRNIQIGDYFYPYGLNKKKKLSKYLIDKKIPLHLRQHQMVISCGEFIIAVIGLSIDHRFQVTTNTKKILHLSIKNSPIDSNRTSVSKR